MNNPRWLRELEAALSLSRQFVLWGNVRDLSHIRRHGEGGGHGGELLPLPDALWWALSRHGSTFMVRYDQVDGLSLHRGSDAEIAGRVLGRRLGEEPVAIPVEELGPIVRRVTAPKPRHRAAIVIDYASRLRGPGDVPPDRVHDLYVLCHKLSHTAARIPSADNGGPPCYNPVIWVLEGERDLPDWFVAGNDDVRLLPVPHPDLDERAAVAEMLLGGFPSGQRPDDLGVAAGRLAAASDGLRLRALQDVSRIMAARPDLEIEDAVTACKVGTDDSPWRGQHLWGRIAGAEDDKKGLHTRVLGQPTAVTMSLDILKRSAVGLSGAQSSSQPNRPRGVLFFAGPTGVGKTELAKQLAELVFGDTEAMVRFDMSEYRGSENAARLIGAPPGYTGHDAGGQLTNAVRERPFRLLLFDEIEKAHGSILDNFLQILDDGRLTDGRGATVHFTECLIVFTSNLGISTRHPDGTVETHVQTGDGYDVVRTEVRAAIKRHFHDELRRPELLNRIGENVIVFDFIRPPVDRQIFDLMVANVIRRVQRVHGMQLTIDPLVLEELAEFATANLDYGGRGVGNRVETALVNPLGRAMFTYRELERGAGLSVVGAKQEGEIWTLQLASG